MPSCRQAIITLYVRFYSRARKQQLAAHSASEGKLRAMPIQIIFARSQVASGPIDSKELIGAAGLSWRVRKPRHGRAANYLNLSQEHWQLLRRQFLGGCQ